MPNTEAATIQSDYLEKLYYFALKKTGSKYEAEDLAQDIASQALISLAKGSRPDDLSHWIWTIARNRYAHWAKVKTRRSGMFLGEVSIATIPDENATAEEQLLYQENLAILRRELSLLASSYREIIVAYYFEGERLSDIAARLGLPEGTVKRRLTVVRSSPVRCANGYDCGGACHEAAPPLFIEVTGSIVKEGIGLAYRN